jgi:phosphatidate cytidylyltransferase
MLQRVITGSLLIIGLALVLYLGGWVFAVVAMAAICVAMREEFQALAVAGHSPVWWPTFVAMVASIPLMLLSSGNRLMSLLLILMLANCLMVLIWVIFREEPRLIDALVSVMPMFAILLPGICLISLLRIEAKSLQVTLLCLVFAISVIGDTMAYFVGTRVGGRKLCPAVSPNKTVSGAIGGLIGSVAGALAVGGIAAIWPPLDGTLPPTFVQYLLIGFVGGIAAQVGDLFASLIKRHCGIKDYGSLFPGHGGMLDRMDSILFTAVVVYCFWMITRA